MRNARWVRRFDWPLLLCLAATAALGLSTLFSALVPLGATELSPIFQRQAFFFLLGTLVMLPLILPDYRFLERGAYLIYGGAVFLLVLVLVLGVVKGGSRRWLDLGFFAIQPSEPAKVALVVAVARYFHRTPVRRGFGLRGLLRPTVFFLLPLATLTFLEPDLGTTLFLGFIFLSMVFVAGLRPRVLVGLVLLGALSAPVVYSTVLTDYQRDRVEVILQPDLDPRGKGHQTIQSRWAIGSGQLYGKGYRQGTQGQFSFLPEHHTDFIFAVYAEERGFVGSVVALGLYLGLMLAGLGVAWRARDRFGALLATGIVTLFFWQCTINLGGVLGLLPVTGVTLPLMSYGGSSVLTVFACCGILLNVSLRRHVF